MNSTRRVTIAASVILLFTICGTVAALRALDRMRSGSTFREVLYISSPKAVQRMSLGYTGLVADLYWTRAVQYFGSQHHQHSRDFHLLAPLLTLATHLDPKLTPAYEFGNNFLAPAPPNGAGEPQQAIAIAEYGIEHNPNNWKLYYGLGFIYYTELKDYSKAAEAFSRGADVPGAHPFLRILAARMAQHAGEFETARMLWTTTLQTSPAKDIQRNATDHLRALRVDEDVTHLEKLVDLYRQQYGLQPQSIVELVRAGLLDAVPVDPTGQPYKITPDGRVEVRNPDDILYITKGTPPNYEPPRPKPDTQK
jgi:tetratricopeptide (TPR) repeat protein